MNTNSKSEKDKNELDKKGQAMGSEKFGNKENVSPPNTEQKNFIREEHVLMRGQPMGSAKFGNEPKKEEEDNSGQLSKHTKTDKGNDLLTDPVKITQGQGGKFEEKQKPNK